MKIAIFCDIDGTLFRSGKKAHPADVEGWKAALKKRMTPLPGVREHMRELNRLATVIMLTARPPSVEAETRSQLRSVGWRGELHMCPVGAEPMQFKRETADRIARGYRYAAATDDDNYNPRIATYFPAGQWTKLRHWTVERSLMEICPPGYPWELTT